MGSGLLARARSFWRGLRQPERASAEMDEEMRFHIEMEAERLMRERGLNPDEARRQAAIAFGGVERHKEDGREVRGLAWVSGLSLDVRLAWRMLGKSWGLAIVAVLGIGLGVAVGVGSFIVLSGWFYPDLPLDEGERIVAIQAEPLDGRGPPRTSLQDFLTWRDGMRSVEEIAAARRTHSVLITGEGTPRPVRRAEVTAAAFQVARVPPLLGRYIVAEDERGGARRVAVIAYDLWQVHFEGDPGVLGRPVLLGDAEHVVVGVMPPAFSFPVNEEVWTALPTYPPSHQLSEESELFVFGRLAERATWEQAQAELDLLGSRVAAASSTGDPRTRTQLYPYTYPLDSIDSQSLWDAAQLQLMINLLLLAVAVNVSMLVYARTAMRRGEIAVRSALGASRGRIVMQLFVEALLLSTLGAGLGLLVSYLVLQQAETLVRQFGHIGFWWNFGLRPSTFAFTLGLAVVASVIIGVLPGLRSTGRKLEADLRSIGSGTSPRIGGMWTALIVVQVAIAVAVLPAAMNLGVGVLGDMATRPNFPIEEFLGADVAVAVPVQPGVDGEAYRREVRSRFADRILELEARLEAEPAVAGVTLTGSLPENDALFEVEGVSGPHDAGGFAFQPSGVATDFFDVLGVRLLSGRGFQPSDATTSARPIIVNESFVRRVLDGGEATGRRLRFLQVPDDAGASDAVVRGPWFEIVGVVEDRYSNPFDKQSGSVGLYYPLAPGQLQWATLLIHVRGEAEGFAPQLRQIGATLDPDLRLVDVGSLAARQGTRYLAIALAVFIFALATVILLSALGIHALMSLTVTRRRREIGIRAALGARSGRLLGSIFSRAAWQLGVGGLLGAVLGAGLQIRTGGTRGEAALLLPAVITLMLTVGLAAAVGPARRGLRVQPMEALREE
jgi:putative ABC transport system permease protein